MRRMQVPVLVNCDKRIVRAFTLVELLVVGSIIALLISILMPSLKGTRDQAKAVKCAASSRQIGQAVSMYLAENSGYVRPNVNLSGSYENTILYNCDACCGYHIAGRGSFTTLGAPDTNRVSGKSTHDGVAITPWHIHESDDDCDAGAIAIDTAIQSQGKAFPWVDQCAALIVPATCTSCEEPTFETPATIAEILPAQDPFTDLAETWMVIWMSMKLMLM